MIMEPKIKDIAVLISSLNINRLEAVILGKNLYKPCWTIVKTPDNLEGNHVLLNLSISSNCIRPIRRFS